MEVGFLGRRPSSSPQSRRASRRRRRRRNGEWGQGSDSTDGEWEALPSIWGRVGGRSLGRTRGRGHRASETVPRAGARAGVEGWACEPVLGRGSKTPKVGAGEWGWPWRSSPASLRITQHAERLAQGRPLMAPHESVTVSIFFNQFNKILD